MLLPCRPKIVDGRIQKFVAEQALLQQAFIKDTTKTVATVIKEAVATVGEKISIRRFERLAQHALGSHVFDAYLSFFRPLHAVVCCCVTLCCDCLWRVTSVIKNSFC